MKFLFFVIHGIRYINRYVYGFFIKLQFAKHGKGFYVKPFSTIKGGKWIYIGNKFSAGKDLRLEAWEKYNERKYKPSIIIGDRVCIGNNCHIASIEHIEINDDVLMGSNIFITDHYHGDTTYDNLKIPPLKRDLFSKGNVIIEESVWIGDGVAIMPGVKIGKNSIVGANSVVTHDVPSFTVVAGCPAQIIKEFK